MARPMSVFVSIGAKLLPSLGSSVSSAERRIGLFARNTKLKLAETRLEAKRLTSAMSPLMSMAAAGGLTMGLKSALGEGADYQHQISMLRVAGRTSQETARAIAQANRTMLAVPTSTLSENLKILNETTLAYGNFGHALENLTFNQKMGGMLGNMLGDKMGDPARLFNNLIRGMEIRGSALDHTRYQREAGGLFKAMIATGGVVNPESILGFVQQANPAVRGYDERFFTKIVPSLIQEFGGERAGTGLTAFNNQILGRVGVGGKSITQEWVRLGLVPPNGTGGNLSKSGWTPGSLKETGLAMADPFKWAETVLLPAMAKMGIDINNEKDVTLETKRLFGRETGARIASTLLSPAQRARLHKDEALFNRAMGPDKAFAEAMKNDPKMGLQALKAGLKNVETSLGKVVFSSGLIGGVNMLAGGLDRLAWAFDRHPNFAKGVMGLMGLGAVTATLKTLNIGLRWAFSPLAGIARLAGRIGAPLWRLFGPMMFRGILAAGTFLRAGMLRLGPIALRGLMLIGPWLLRGVAMAFGLLSNPVGWAILAASAALLIWRFRSEIAKAWTFVTNWFATSAWPAIKATFSAVGEWGTSIVDGLIASLTSAWPRLKAWVGNAWSNTMPTWLGGTPVAAPVTAPLGARPVGAPPPLLRAGGPVVPARRSPQAVMPGGRGPLIGAGGAGGGVGPVTFNIHGVSDPHAVARAVDRRLADRAKRQGAGFAD